MYTLQIHLGYTYRTGTLPLDEADDLARLYADSESIGNVRCLASWQRNKECYRYHAWNGQKWVLVATIESVA